MTRLFRSWDEFKKELRQKDGAPLDPIYRGQGQANWSLVPPSKRPRFEQMKRHSELAKRNANLAVRADYSSPAFDGQQKFFARLATGLPGVDLRGLNPDDLEALARHNGLCSNLLDWTTSPYVAAFFAFSVALDRANDGRLTAGTLGFEPIHSPMDRVAIWRLGVRPDVWVEGEFDLLRDLASVNQWQKAQEGVFTRLRHDEIARVEQYLDARGLSDTLVCYEISGQYALTALAELNEMGITFARLFPDLRGAALHANLASVLRIF